MKKYFLILGLFVAACGAAQDDVYPAGPQVQTIVLYNGTIA